MRLLRPVELPPSTCAPVLLRQAGALFAFGAIQVVVAPDDEQPIRGN
jgi:hypothetical protein